MGSTDVQNSFSDTAYEERPRICQAQGCEVNVNPFGRYCKKRRLCPEHLKASSLRRKKYGDEKWRFCQQCGKLELIKNFDGLKRSCRVQLARRRAANNSKGERRRSTATERSRSTDNRSSSAGGSLSQEEAQAGATGDHASSAANAEALSKADNAAAAAAADDGDGDAIMGLIGMVTGVRGARQLSPAIQPNADAPFAAAAFSAGMPAAELQPCVPTSSGLQLDSFLQYGLDGAAGFRPEQQQQQQQQQQLLPGSVLLAQHANQGMFGLQQQQQGSAAVSSTQVNRTGVKTEPVAGGAAQDAGGSLFRQLLHQQQQLRGWQQLQPSSFLPSHNPGPVNHQDVYTLALEAGADSTGFGGSAGMGMNGLQPQPLPLPLQLQQQHSSLSQQHILQPQQHPLEEAQSYTGAAAGSGSSGGLPTGGSVAEATFLGLMAPAGTLTSGQHEAAANLQMQFAPRSYAAPMPQSSFALLQDSGLPGGRVSLVPQQQQVQQGGPFQDPAFNQQPGWVPASNSQGPLPDFDGLEELLAVAGAVPGTRNDGIHMGCEGLSSDIRSLSAADNFGFGRSLSARQQQPLRAFDSAPPQAGQVSTSGRGLEGGGGGTGGSSLHSGLMDFSGCPVAAVPQSQPMSGLVALAGPQNTASGLGSSLAALPASMTGAGVLGGNYPASLGMAVQGDAAGIYGQQLMQQLQPGDGGPWEQSTNLLCQQLQQQNRQLGAEMQAMIGGRPASLGHVGSAGAVLINQASHQAANLQQLRPANVYGGSTFH